MGISRPAGGHRGGGGGAQHPHGQYGGDVRGQQVREGGRRGALGVGYRFTVIHYCILDPATRRK
jgi:hypothetical protein